MSDISHIDTIYDIPDKDNKINEIIDRNTYNKMIDGLEKKEKEIVSLKVLTNFTFKEIGEIKSDFLEHKYKRFALVVTKMGPDDNEWLK